MSGAADQIRAAREAMDRIMAERPKSDGAVFTAATQAMCAYRDDLRHALKADPADAEARGRLDDANQAVTLLMSGHFPLGETPWDQLEMLREHLHAMERRESA